MSFLKKNALLGFTAISSLLLLSGCDKLPNFSDYFSSKPKTQTTKAQASTAASTVSTPAAQPAPVGPDVLVQVGNWTLTMGEFKERLKALKEAVPQYDPKDMEQNKMVLEELIRQQLLVQDAEKSGVADSKDITQAVDEFRRTLLVREVAMKIAKTVPPATEQEAQDYYTKNEKDFVEPAGYKLREIVVKTEAEAKQILTELYNGADFGETVKKSIGKSAAKNGAVENIEFAKMESIVSTLEVGGISSVFQGPEGYYIVKLDGKSGGEKKKFAEIKEDVKNGLTMLKQQQAILDYLNKLREKTPVTVNEKLLEELKTNEPRK